MNEGGIYMQKAPKLSWAKTRKKEHNRGKALPRRTAQDPPSPSSPHLLQNLAQKVLEAKRDILRGVLATATGMGIGAEKHTPSLSSS